MIQNATNTTGNLKSPILAIGLFVVSLACTPTAALAEELAGGKSFIENFDRLDTKHWYVSDGWANGDHQNCTWSKGQVEVADGTLRLGFAKQQTKDRAYVCGEIQTNPRYGYGAYEIRMKAVAGSGLNTGFFTYIGPVHKQPHDEIDFEVLGKNPSKVQINTYVDGKNAGPERLVDVPGGADQGFNDYAFVWEKDRIRWYVNDELVGEATDPAKLPSHASKIYLSLWGSDTLKSWMGTFAEPAGPVAAEIDRIAFTAAGDACQFPESIVCKLN